MSQRRRCCSSSPGVEAFATPKPERLIERIVRIATDPGDIVLDFFAGSGTTSAVAHKMGRRWVTVERSHKNLEVFARPRLQRVVNGEDAGGVTKPVGWAGGGGFRVLKVAPSMFEPDESGRTFLSEWASCHGHLGEAVAAQLGYPYIEHRQFLGLKGRRRLAVIDGLVSTPVLQALAEGLPEGETMEVVGRAIADEAADTARQLVRGARVRKIPGELLLGWRRAERRPT